MDRQDSRLEWGVWGADVKNLGYLARRAGFLEASNAWQTTLTIIHMLLKYLSHRVTCSSTPPYCEVSSPCSTCVWGGGGGCID